MDEDPSKSSEEGDVEIGPSVGVEIGKKDESIDRSDSGDLLIDERRATKTKSVLFDYDYPRPATTEERRKDFTSTIPSWPFVFCCSRRVGRIIVCCACPEGPDKRMRPICVLGACWPVSMWWTFVILAVPGVIFVTLGRRLPLPVNVVGIIIQLVTLISFWGAAFGDPGIFPRYSYPPDGEPQDRDEENQTATLDNRDLDISKSEDEDNNTEKKGSEIVHPPAKKISRWRYCEKAKSYRPPGVMYCNESAVLIEKVDHFCPVIGNTIAKKNMLAFQVLLGAHCLLMYYVFGVFVAGILDVVDVI